MGKSLKGFKPSENKRLTDADVQKLSNEFSKEEISSVKTVTDKYKGKSSNQVFNDIISMVSQEKRKGQLSDSDLVSFANQVSPMLNAEQKKELSKLLQAIKK